jgi:uncharacterized membrane protein
MTDATTATATPRTVEPSLVSWTHWMYALHALGAVIGVLGAPTIAVSFVFSVPSIIAVIMNYLKRGEVRGTWLDSHFSWQLRTFWWALAWILLIGLFSAPLILLFGLGLVTWVVGIIVVGIWIIYRVARGWLRLKDGQPI